MMPLIATVWIGFTFTTTAVSLWSSIPYTVPVSSVGTANGIASCMMDLTVGLTSLAMGQIMTVMQNPDGTICEDGWKYAFILLFGHATLSACGGILLNCYSKKKGDVLNTSTRRATSIGPVHFPESDDDAAEVKQVYVTNSGDQKEIIYDIQSSCTRSSHPNGLYKVDGLTYADSKHVSNGSVHNDTHSNDEQYPYEETFNHKDERVDCNGFHDVKL